MAPRDGFSFLGPIGLRTFAAPGPAQTGANLVCFPPVGGYSLVFKPLAQALGSTVTVSALDPPGHGASRARLLESIDEMARTYLDLLGVDLLSRSILFGHSLGGYVAFHVAQALEALGRPPRGVVLAGAAAFHRRREQPTFLGLDDDELLRRLVALGGIAPEVAAEREIFDLFKGLIRTDFGAYERCPIPSVPVSSPSLVLHAEDDHLVPADWLEDWSSYLVSAEHEVLPGGHFFVSNDPGPVAARLRAFFTSAPARR